MFQNHRRDLWRRFHISLPPMEQAQLSPRIDEHVPHIANGNSLRERSWLGGSVRIIVLDNLREGVLTPDIYEPALNPLYRDLLVHYGAVAMPCRVKDPNRKGKVEARRGPRPENTAQRTAF